MPPVHVRRSIISISYRSNFGAAHPYGSQQLHSQVPAVQQTVRHGVGNCGTGFGGHTHQELARHEPVATKSSR